MKINRLVITPGEPAGIGPDLCIQAAQSNFDVELIVIADPEMLAARAALLNLPLQLTPFDPAQPSTIHRSGTLKVLPIALHEKAICGLLSSNNSKYVLESIAHAAQGCMDNMFDAMVTGPVHKGIINEAGITFSGHTEFLAEQSNTEQVVMMLATEGLRVTLATTHLPLNRVSQAITQSSLEQTIRIIFHNLKRYFGLKQPNILVCGLNPHAGENGHMGMEEIEVITPVLEKLRREGFNLEGPLPADSLFTPIYMQRADSILAMYHDQGLPVLKHMGFGHAVNVTLGLPFIRTSVDHGTALDLAGKGTANTGSLKVAIQTAIEMINHSQNQGTYTE